MRRLNFLLTGLLAVLLASCNQRVQNIENKPAVKIDTVPVSYTHLTLPTKA